EEKVRKRTNDLLKEKQKVEKQHQLITESLQYASTIQHAILPHQQVIMRNIPESFILFKPKDIVSGDFYWAAKTNGKIIIAAVDCTGHGVPGAMLSMLGYTQLNQIVRENGITNPPDILTRLHDNMQNLLNQKFMHSGSSDGMDISLCCIDQKENRVSYAGAMRPLFRYRNGELSIFSGNRMPIGGKYRNGTQYFQGDEFLYERGDTIYLFTDGYIDQFGGNEGKKFKSRNFKTLLKTIHQLPAEQQLEALEKQFNTWKGNEEQVDDILVIGLRM
ncbi:MAG: SpoIIE family protein phosphatase, partial [Flavobacteriales bacterium]|nr:SpoIIE family protein phosphatase [Flavobacteriales bacterium]